MDGLFDTDDAFVDSIEETATRTRRLPARWASDSTSAAARFSFESIRIDTWPLAAGADPPERAAIGNAIKQDRTSQQTEGAPRVEVHEQLGDESIPAEETRKRSGVAENSLSVE